MAILHLKLRYKNKSEKGKKDRRLANDYFRVGMVKILNPGENQPSALSPPIDLFFFALLPLKNKKKTRHKAPSKQIILPH